VPSSRAPIEHAPAEHDEGAAEAERDFQAQVAKHLPRNFTAHMIHGILGQTAFRIMQAPTFLPAYVLMLSGSNSMVGVARACQALGTSLTPVIGASLIEHRPRVLRMTFATGAAMRLCVLGLALAGFFLGAHANLIAICVLLGLYGFFTGMQSVTFSFLMSKVIPVERRGALGGTRSAVGGLFASAVGVMGGYLVAHNALGNGYATVFLVSFVMATGGLMAMTIMREPASPDVKPRQPLGARLRELPALLRSDADYRSYMLARALGAGGRLAVPYYSIYADKELHLPIEGIAWLTGAYLFAYTLSTIAWGLLADRQGFRNVLAGGLVVWAAATLLLIHSVTLYAAMFAFIGLGAGQGGFELGSMNLVLEFGARKDLPMRIAMAQTGEQFVSIIAPIAGGLLVDLFSYRHMLWTAVGVLVTAFVVTALRVNDPRHRTIPPPVAA
jgi:MFS family permease